MYTLMRNIAGRSTIDDAFMKCVGGFDKKDMIHTYQHPTLV